MRTEETGRKRRKLGENGGRLVTGVPKLLPPLILVFAGVFPLACGPGADAGSDPRTRSEESAEEPVAHIDYLGHASLLLTFGPHSQNPVTVLTDSP